MSETKLKYDGQGLIPAIIQDVFTNEVLMLAYMNEESFQKTLATGMTWFFSRSRSELWHKGETSGHVQKVREIFYDCDADTLLLKVEQTGAACHEGTYSCFSRKIWQQEESGSPQEAAVIAEKSLANVLFEISEVINDRKHNQKEGSYTAYLFQKGQDKILKKIGEEAAETIIASKNNVKGEILYEMADLWYHSLVLLAHHNISPQELLEELDSRRK